MSALAIMEDSIGGGKQMFYDDLVRTSQKSSKPDPLGHSLDHLSRGGTTCPIITPEANSLVCMTKYFEEEGFGDFEIQRPTTDIYYYISVRPTHVFNAPCGSQGEP
ncbi:hypothetical protein J437_LFUL002339 [Ladona fulva]|uniref:Uncharacterized protein n=1 Tax=Ladona fulva TaxID=123851 RepID=A0A8K0K714_LADFU|nr:hypothetical protein J437_LFUL002339 [Ladona fulva]